MSWGGVREGAGRPVGTTKKGGQRKQRQLRAYDDEWDIINRFAKMVKHGDKEACIKILEELEKNQ